MKTLFRILLAAVAYVMGAMVTGALAPVLHLPVFKVPADASAQRFVMFALSTPLLTIGLAALAAGLRGNWGKRFGAIASLLYVAIGLNTMIEAKIFTHMIDGSAFAASLHSVLPCVFAAAVLATIKTDAGAALTMLPFEFKGWSWRLVVAWLMFPVIYWTFGMCVAPFVIGYYDSGILGLRIPPPAIILETQLLRSALFLAASLPTIWLWRKSRGQFILGMGLAHAFAVGIFQLAGATFMPAILRILHSIEITADSFAYAAVLGLLFIAKTEPAKAETVERLDVKHSVAV